MMNSKLLIRISAFFILVHLLGHTMGHMNWDDETGPLFGVVKEMKSHSAEFMGVTKSMADYYNGYSLIMFGLFGMTVFLLWVLSSYTTTNRKLVRQMLYPIGIAYLFFGIIEWMYFFPFASVVSIIAGIFSILATLKLNND